MADRPQSSGAIRELDPMIGLTISGRYRVHALVGQGGMGKVFQAQQIPLGRSVALKVLDASRVDQEFHRRFFQEAAILAKLQSRHTVTIYDYGRDGDIYFIAMELVGGGSLDRVIANDGPFPPRRALSIALQISRSLREAHAQGVIHRDLKPANVVLTHTEDGEELVKVLDFGLAKRLDRNTDDETQADTVPGSPKYMAPEVIRQQPIDGRTDMYALGVMLYQMLCGVVPFDRPAAMDILLAHLQEPPRPLREANPKVTVPPALERVVMRCLDKLPERRYADMQQLIDTLRQLANELGLGGESTLTGASVRPDPAPSGLRNRASEAPAPHVAAQDLQGGRPATVSHGPPRAALMVVAGSAVLAAVILGIALWRAGANATTSPPPAPVPSPVAAAPVAPAAGDPAALDMVISAEEASASPTVRIDVSSDPAGAQVFVRGKHLGMTPVSFDWTDPQARVGGTMVMVLRLAGYNNQTIRRTIDGRPIKLTATLAPADPAQPAATAQPARVEPANEQAAPGSSDELRALDDRAKSVSAETAPVIVVKPAKPDSLPPPTPNQPTDEEAEAP
ncbi:MAG TPA: serine/threonine-protein kinase [Polyangiales bacterium]|nr:serine/threonine-protein kinase [Polyangiales bacterium]